jgi:uncharacterized SAM-binding protein YcdF (DUF218 family)
MKTSLSFKLVTAILLIFFAWIFFAWFLAERLIVEKPLEHADAILVLGGSSVYQERTQKAALVYKQGIAQKVLLTDDGGRAGWSRKEQRNPLFVELAEQSLIAQGVPAENIEILKPKGSGTIYEAQFLRDKIKENSWKSILIVTSAYHTRRSLWTFEREIADKDIEIGIVSPPPGQQTPPPFYWWLSPFGWDVVAGEYVKTFYYWVYY